MIYAIQAKGTNYVKIGYAQQQTTKERLQSMQSNCPFVLELIATREGNREEEGQVHIHYHPQRMKGEWFDLIGR